MPTVSVVMPVHNAERYVGRAIQSILDQTYSDFELIIIDDGSTDGSLVVLRQYATQDPRIRLSSRAWRGIAPTRQELLALCTGRFCAMMDADDESEPQRLEQQVAYLAQHPDCVCVTCRILLTDSDGSPIRTVNLETSHEEIDAANLSGCIFGGAYMVRRDVLLEIGGIRDFPLGYDLDMFLRLAEHGRLACVPAVLYRYRQHLSNSTLRWQEVNAAATRAVQEALLRRGVPADERPSRLLPGAPLSSLAQRRKWAWWALAAGHKTTARKHAFAALWRAPWSLDSWRLLACAIREY
jgi:glycosyltransferase involved in cell wall biosynthesis